MRIRQMKAEIFYIVQTLVDVKVGLDVTPVHIEGLECCPWTVLRGQIPASGILREAKDSADASENMNLHALLHDYYQSLAQTRSRAMAARPQPFQAETHFPQSAPLQ
jgi:hypothetical protein